MLTAPYPHTRDHSQPIPSDQLQRPLPWKERIWPNAPEHPYTYAQPYMRQSSPSPIHNQNQSKILELPFHPFTGCGPSLPVHARRKGIHPDPILMLNCEGEHLLDHFHRHLLWPVPQRSEPTIGWFVVMGLKLGAGVLDVLNAGREIHPLGRFLHHSSQGADKKCLCKLIEHPEFPRLRRMKCCDLHAAHSVRDMEISPRLPALAIDTHRLASGGLRNKTIQHSPENVIVI